MDKFTRLTGPACPINQANLNTDQILPARYLKWTRAMGIGKVLFQDKSPKGGRKEISDHLPLWAEFEINKLTQELDQIIRSGGE